MFKKVIAVFLVLHMAIFMTACGSIQNQPGSNTGTAHKANIPLPDTKLAVKLPDRTQENFTYEMVAENQDLAFLYDKNNNTMQILDKRNGYIWESAIHAKEKGMTVNSTWEQNLASLFNITYTLKNSKGQERVLQSSTRKQTPYIWTTPIKDGICLEYYFENKKIGFRAEFILDGNALELRIPDAGIREGGDVKLVSIEVLPIFGAAPNGSQGYMVVPDSSGALIDFSDVTKKGSMYRWFTYSTDKLEMNPYNKLDPRSELESSQSEMAGEAMLPVHGVKNGENAFVAFASAGEHDYKINVSTSGFGIDLNRICGEFTLHRSYEVKGSEVKTGSGDEQEQAIYEIIDEERIPTDRNVRYIFLQGENADYSGMANVYRSYLLDNGKLNPSRISQISVPLSLDLFMGVEEKRMMSNKFISMTTFEQGEEIIGALKQKGVKNLVLNLKGWSERGYGSYPIHSSAEGALGGDKGLKALNRYCKEQGFHITVEANFVDVIKDNAGFALRNELVKDGNGFTVSDVLNEKFLLNPLNVVKQFQRFNSAMKDVELLGVNFDRLGSLIYADGQDANPAHKHETASQWCNILETAKKEYSTVGIRGGNLYGLQYADLVYDIPVGGSKSLLTDRDIPFYQMVVHGSIPYVSSPINLYYDHVLQKLKNIEYGGLPYFELTYGEAYQLQNTSYNKLFSSNYKQWLDHAAEYYREYNEKLLPVVQSYIVKHEYLEPDIVRIIYANGCKLYINYSNAPVTVENVEVNPMDYSVVR